jgi:ubiquitin C-terminal hydrolase
MTSSLFASRVLSPHFPPILSARLFAAFCQTDPSRITVGAGGDEECCWENFAIGSTILLMGTVEERSSLLFSALLLGPAQQSTPLLTASDLVRFTATVLYDRPRPVADYHAAVKDVFAAARARKPEVMTAEEWKLFTSVLSTPSSATATPPLTSTVSFRAAKGFEGLPKPGSSAFHSHPLTGWTCYAARCFMPSGEETMIEERWAEAKRGEGRIADKSDISDAATFTAEDLSRAYSTIRAASDAGVLDAAALCKALLPCVPRLLGERLFWAADSGKHGALAMAGFSQLTNALLGGLPEAQQALLFDMFAQGSGMPIEGVRMLLECTILCTKVQAGTTAGGLDGSSIVDAGSGKVDDRQMASATALAKTKSRDLLPPTLEEMRSMQPATPAADVITRAAFMAWTQKRPELLSCLSVAQTAFRIELGMKPVATSTAQAIMAQAQQLASCMRPFRATAPGAVGDTWFVCPSSWLRALLAAIAAARTGASLGSISPVDTTPLLQSSPVGWAILRPGLNEDKTIVHDLLRCLESGADRPSAPSGDYALITRRAWKAISSWYGLKGLPIARQVIAANKGSHTHSTVPQLELYPPWVQVYRLTREMPAKAQGGKGLSPTELPAVPPSLQPLNNASSAAQVDSSILATNVYIFSASDTISDVIAMLARLLYVPATAVRLWGCSTSAAAPVLALSASNDDARTHKAKNYPPSSLWPFLPLFGGESSATTLGELDILDDQGACIVVDVQSVTDGRYASMALGYAALYFMSHSSGEQASTQPEDDKPRAAAARTQFRRASAPPLPPIVYPGSIGRLPDPVSTQVTAKKSKDKALPLLLGPEAAGLPLPASKDFFWKFTRRPAAVVGFANLGNTCYLNSALQCLLHTPFLSPYFLVDEWAFDVNLQAKLGTGGYIAAAFADLAQEVWKADGTAMKGSSVHTASIAPRRLKHWLAEAAPRFSGNEQHDSQEALTTLLSFLAEDCNRVKEKPYVEQPDSNGRPDGIVAEEWWVGHLKREQNVISSLFTGQFKSVLTCDNCGFTSARFEPFTTLSLPLPESKQRVMSLTVIFPHPALRPLVLSVTFPATASVRDIKRKVAVEITRHCRKTLAAYLDKPGSPASDTDGSGNGNGSIPSLSISRQPSISEGTKEDDDSNVSATPAFTSAAHNGVSMQPVASKFLAVRGLQPSTDSDFALSQPQYEQLLVADASCESSDSYYKTFNFVAVDADRLVLARASGHVLLESSDVSTLNASSFASGSSYVTPWELDDATLLSSIRDNDPAAFVMFVAWSPQHYRTAFQRTLDRLRKVQAPEAGPPFAQTGAHVLATWKGAKDKFYPAIITCVHPAVIDSDEDDAAKSAVEPTYDLRYYDGDVDTNVSAMELRPLDPTPIALGLLHRTFSSSAFGVPFGHTAATDPSMYTYTSGTCKPVQLAGFATSPRMLTSPTGGTASNETSMSNLLLPSGIGAVSGMHGVGGNNSFGGGYSTPPSLFTSLQRVTFGTPHLLHMLPSDPVMHLYRIIAHLSQRYIRRGLPVIGNGVVSADAAATDIMAVWGFVVRRVDSRNPLICSQCSWLRCCAGCVLRPTEFSRMASVRMRNGETLAVEWDPVLLEECVDKLELLAKDVHSSVVTVASSESTSLRLEQCLDVFSREEKLDESGFCSRCSRVKVMQASVTSPGKRELVDDIVMRPQTKRLEVWRTPPVLVVQLKRFQHTQFTRKKLNNLVDFPVEGLSLTPYMARAVTHQPPVDLSIWKSLGGKVVDESLPSSPPPAPPPVPMGAAHKRLRAVSTGPTESSFAGLPNWLSRSRGDYDLYAVVSHYGMLGAGHYVAFAQSLADDKWYCYNDRIVTPVTDMSEVVSQAAYILFYVRRDMKQGWMAALRNEDVLAGRSITSHDGTPSHTLPRCAAIEAWDVFPHRPESTPADVARLKAQIANAGLAAEALGLLDSLADKCTIA